MATNINLWGASKPTGFNNPFTNQFAPPGAPAAPAPGIAQAMAPTMAPAAPAPTPAAAAIPNMSTQAWQIYAQAQAAQQAAQQAAAPAPASMAPSIATAMAPSALTQAPAAAPAVTPAPFNPASLTPAQVEQAYHENPSFQAYARSRTPSGAQLNTEWGQSAAPSMTQMYQDWYNQQLGMRDAMTGMQKNGRPAFGSAGVVANFSVNTPWMNTDYSNTGVRPGQVAAYPGQEAAFADFQAKFPGYAQVGGLESGAGAGVKNIRQYVDPGSMIYDPTYGYIAPVTATGYAGKKGETWLERGGLQALGALAPAIIGIGSSLYGAGSAAAGAGDVVGGGGLDSLIGGGADALTTGGGGVGLRVPMSAVDAALGQGIPSLGVGAVPSTVGLGSPTLGAFGAGPGLQIGTAALDSLVSGALPGIIGGFPDLGAVYSGIPGVVTGNTGSGILSVGGQAPSTFGSDFLNELLRNPIGNFAPDVASMVTPSLTAAAEPYGTMFGVQAYPKTTIGAAGSGINAAAPGLKLSTLPGTTSYGTPALGTATASLPFVSPQGNWLQRAFGSLYNDPAGTLFNKLDDPDTLLRLLGLGGSLASTFMGADAIKDAARNASAAADPYAAQRPAQAGAFNQTLATGPATGKAAELTANPNLITQLPNYQWNLDQGLDAINRKAAATGNLESGNRLLALQKYAQGYAADQYGAEFGRRAQLDDQAFRDWLAKLNATGQASGAYNNPATAAGISASGNNAAIQTMYGGINDVLDQVFNPRVRNQQSLQDELLRQLRIGGTLW